jgi:aspartyl-tRNA(Asn)/glutamyl-tRNA(Gln) amidotransferase subunit B
MENQLKYEAVIGLEIHAQIKTKSKMFCSCSTEFGAKPNSQICPICSGMPGVLPVLNKKAVEFAIKTAFALNSLIQDDSVFARKNYFYPDLPKGYQISQFEKPFAKGGSIEIGINGNNKRIGITRVHLEEDAGKLVHIGSAAIAGASASNVDLNRAGVPLMEIVSEPDINSSEEAKKYVEAIRAILQYLEVSDANMEEGNLRCDANVSVRAKGAEKLGVKTEVKNMNSLRALQKALDYEILRQIQVLEENGKIIQETRHFDESTEATISLRSKEESHDYRYFPEPDLIVLAPEESWIKDIEKTIPLLPQKRKENLLSLGLSADEAEVIISEKERADFFEKCILLYPNAKIVSNWLIGDILGFLNQKSLALHQMKLTPEKLAGLLKLIDEGIISGKIAKEILPQIIETGKTANELVQEKGLQQVQDSEELKKIILSVIQENSSAVSDYKNGKTSSLQFLLGQVMKKTKGRANPQVSQKILKEALENGV